MVGNHVQRFALSELLVRPTMDVREDKPEYLLRLAFVNGLPSVQCLAPAGYRPGAMRICPLCIQEHGKWFQDWRTSPVPICHQHQAWLLEKCTECGSSMSWSNSRLMQCHCGMDLTLQPVEPVSASLQNCLAIGSDAPFDVLLWLGAWDIYGPLAKPLKKASCKSVDERRKLLEKGADIACGWPRSFNDSLLRHRVPSSSNQIQRLCKAWPGLISQIGRINSALWVDRIWRVVNQVVENSHLTAEPVVGRNPKLTAQPKTQKAVANALGIGSARLQTLILNEALSVPTNHFRSGRSRRVVAPTMEASLKKSLSTWITDREGAVLLGCGRRRVSAMAEQDLLESRVGRLKRTSVLHLRDQLLQLAAVPSCDVQMVLLTQVFRFHVLAPMSRKFIEAINCHRLRLYCSPSTSNWRGLYVNSDDLNAWLREPSPSEDQMMSLSDAALALTLKEEVVYELANRGFLPTVDGGRKGRRVTHAAISEFSLRYVALARLTQGRQIHSHSALAWARQQGYSVVTGPCIDGGRQYFVEKPL